MRGCTGSGSNTTALATFLQYCIVSACYPTGLHCTGLNFRALHYTKHAYILQCAHDTRPSLEQTGNVVKVLGIALSLTN